MLECGQAGWENMGVCDSETIIPWIYRVASLIAGNLVFPNEMYVRKQETRPVRLTNLFGRPSHSYATYISPTRTADDATIETATNGRFSPQDCHYQTLFPFCLEISLRP